MYIALDIINNIHLKDTLSETYDDVLNKLKNLYVYGYTIGFTNNTDQAEIIYCFSRASKFLIRKK